VPNQRIFNSSELLLSSLIAAGETAMLALWLPLLAGLVGHGTVAPPALGLFVIGMASYWWARLCQTGRFGNQADLLTLCSWVVLAAGWLVVSVDLPPRAADLRDGWLVILLAGVAWLRGSSLAGASNLAAPERAHRLLGQGVLLIGAALMLTFAWHVPAANVARQAAWWAIPVLLLSALTLSAYGVANAVIGSSSESTSHQRAGATGFAAGFVLLAVFLVVLVGGNVPGIQSSLRTAAEFVFFIFFWLLIGLAYAVIYGVVYVFRFIGFRIPFPSFLQHLASNSRDPKQQHHSLPFWLELTIIVVAAAVLTLLLSRHLPRVIRFLRRRRSRGGIQVVRTSLRTSGSLFDNLQDLFKRPRHNQQHGVRIDLRTPPESVRDAYRKLLVLAAQEGQPREPIESPRDFARRLGSVWVDLADPLDELTQCYVATRYGETTSDEDLSVVCSAWERIHRQTLDQPTKTLSTGEVD
jgi:hypothetical protein